MIWWFIVIALTLSIPLQGQWNPGVVCSGHFDSVEDFIWDPSGDFALTVSITSMSPHISSARLFVNDILIYLL